MKKLITICAGVIAMMCMAVSANAADYSFTTAGDTDYYGSTNYEDMYDAAYRYKETNQIDFDIPELKYGLSQQFLEQSLDSPYLTAGTQYGLGSSGAVVENGGYPVLDQDSESASADGTIHVTYTPDVTITQLKQSDGSIGTVAIKRVGLSAKVYEGATTSSMAKGAGHYESSSLWYGNVGLFGHNRGNGVAYFAKLKDVKVGDQVTYTTSLGTKTYSVTFVGSISSTDYSYLNEMGDNRITLITCIANQPSLRLCVQAVEVK